MEEDSLPKEVVGEIDPATPARHPDDRLYGHVEDVRKEMRESTRSFNVRTELAVECEGYESYCMIHVRMSR